MRIRAALRCSGISKAPRLADGMLFIARHGDRCTRELRDPLLRIQRPVEVVRVK